MVGNKSSAPTVAVAKRRFALNLQFIREQRGITQRDLAKSVGVNPSQVSHWENVNSPSFVGAENLTKLGESLRVDIACFFQGSNNKPHPQELPIKTTKAEIRNEAVKLLKRLITKIGA